MKVGILGNSVLVIHNIFPAVLDVSLSRPEYPVNESDQRVTVQVLKDKQIANALALVLNTWTIGEADLMGCLPLNDFQMDTGEQRMEFTSMSLITHNVHTHTHTLPRSLM